MPKDEAREQILREAGPIFAAEGYQGTTVRAICQAAGVNIAAVNYYFGDKERLYIEAVKHARNLIERRWPLPDWPIGTPPEARLRAFIETFVQRLLSEETQAWQMKLLLREMVEPTRACEEMVREGFQPFFAHLIAILRELVVEDLPEPRLHQLGFSIVGQCVFYRAHHRIVDLMVDETERAEHYSVAAIAAHIEQFSRSAIAGMTARRQPVERRCERDMETDSDSIESERIE